MSVSGLTAKEEEFVRGLAMEGEGRPLYARWVQRRRVTARHVDCAALPADATEVRQLFSRKSVDCLVVVGQYRLFAAHRKHRRLEVFAEANIVFEVARLLVLPGGHELVVAASNGVLLCLVQEHAATEIPRALATAVYRLSDTLPFALTGVREDLLPRPADCALRSSSSSNNTSDKDGDDDNDSGAPLALRTFLATYLAACDYLQVNPSRSVEGAARRAAVYGAGTLALDSIADDLENCDLLPVLLALRTTDCFAGVALAHVPPAAAGFPPQNLARRLADVVAANTALAAVAWTDLALAPADVAALAAAAAANPATPLRQLDFSQNDLSGSASGNGDNHSFSSQAQDQKDPETSATGAASEETGFTALARLVEALPGAGVTALALRKTGLCGAHAAGLFRALERGGHARALGVLDVAENALGAGGAAALGAWLRGRAAPPLASLSVAYCGLTAHAVAELLAGAAGTRALRHINVSGVALDRGLAPLLADALRARPTVVSVAMNDCRATAQDIARVLEALAQGHGGRLPSNSNNSNNSNNKKGKNVLEADDVEQEQGQEQEQDEEEEEDGLDAGVELEACSNDVSESDGGAVLAAALAAHPCVRRLALAGNGLCCGALYLVVEALLACPVLAELDLSKNIALARQRRDTDATRMLGNALFALCTQRARVRVLRVAGDPEQGLGGGRGLVEALAKLVGDSRARLYALDVSGNSAGDAAVADLYAAAETNECLEELAADGNGTAARGLRALVTLLSRNRTLARLRLPSADINALVRATRSRAEQRDLVSFFTVASQQVRASLLDNVRAKTPRDGSSAPASPYAAWLAQRLARFAPESVVAAAEAAEAGTPRTPRTPRSRAASGSCEQDATVPVAAVVEEEEKQERKEEQEQKEEKVEQEQEQQPELKEDSTEDEQEPVVPESSSSSSSNSKPTVVRKVPPPAARPKSMMAGQAAAAAAAAAAATAARKSRLALSSGEVKPLPVPRDTPPRPAPRPVPRTAPPTDLPQMPAGAPPKPRGPPPTPQGPALPPRPAPSAASTAPAQATPPPPPPAARKPATLGLPPEPGAPPPVPRQPPPSTPTTAPAPAPAAETTEWRAGRSPAAVAAARAAAARNPALRRTTSAALSSSQSQQTPPPPPPVPRQTSVPVVAARPGTSRGGPTRRAPAVRRNPAAAPPLLVPPPVARSDVKAGIPKPVLPAPRQFVFTADRGARAAPGAPGTRPPLRKPPVIQEVEEEDEDDEDDEDEGGAGKGAAEGQKGAQEAEHEGGEGEGEGGAAPAPPPPLFQADAILKGNEMSFFRDRRLYRKSVALRSAWWADDADLSENPVVPLLPDSAPAPPSSSMALDTTGMDLNAAPVPLI